MASLSKQEKKEKQEKLFDKVMWIPLILQLAVIPLIVRMIPITNSEKVMDVLNESTTWEAYSNYKSTAIIMVCILMAIISFLCIEKQNIKFDQTIKWYLIGGGIFLIVTFIATILSDNKQVAWYGMPDRAEGFIMILCYIFMIIYTLYALRNVKNYIYIIAALSVIVLLTTILGVSQYFGYDLLFNIPILKDFVLGEEARSIGADLTTDFASGKVIGTLGHYNYVGSFGAMMVPFFMVLTLFIRGKKEKIAFSIITLCAMFTLFGSTSRAGFIGLICAMVMMLIIFSKQIIKKWKFTLPIMISLIAILFGFNAMTGGTIFARIPTLITESIGLFSGSDETFNYLDHIPVREVSHENNKMKIVLQEHTLYIGNENNVATFADENGETVNYTAYFTGSAIEFKTTDERFAALSFPMEEVTNVEGEAPVVFSMSYNGMSTFCFMLDQEKGVIMVDPSPLEEETIEFPETVGFKGKEKLGSARGYIWSRSIPLMKETVLVGFGPDTYALEFPQNDYLGKWWAYDTPNMIVDKVHNLYLGIWINHGGLALVGFLIVIGAYMMQCIKLYAFKGYYENREIMGIATCVAIIGYLGAGLFNDSVVSVTPIFAILLGAGMALNFIINRERQSIHIQ